MAKIAPDDKVVIETVLGLVASPVPIRRQRIGHSPQRSFAIKLLPELKVGNKKKVAALIAALDDPYCRALAVTEVIRKVRPRRRGRSAVVDEAEAGFG
jgi:hypothetical protein